MAKRTTKKSSEKESPEAVQVTIAPPNFQTVVVPIRGNAAYFQNKFSNKARKKIIATQKAGSTAKKGKKREPKDFKKACEEAKHVSTEGWCGIPAPAFRNAMISACRIVGFQMTKAKLSVFIVADGYDKDDATPLVKITKGEPQHTELPVRLPDGSTDIRPRPMWEPGWEAKVTIRFDADQFTAEDVANLIHRAGIQVGVGEGRPDSKKSNGCGWGTFDTLAA